VGQLFRRQRARRRRRVHGRADDDLFHLGVCQ
jgi:hypothetical protein